MDIRFRAIRRKNCMGFIGGDKKFDGIGFIVKKPWKTHKWLKIDLDGYEFQDLWITNEIYIPSKILEEIYEFALEEMKTIIVEIDA